VSVERVQKHSYSGELRIPVSGDYHLQLPEERGTRVPLVLFLHGMYEADRIFELVSPPAKARAGELAAAVLSPLSGDTRWSVDFVVGLLDHVCATRPIDPSRIYATGTSIGGLATWEIALRRPSQFAALVPICGAGQPWNAFRIAHVPVWAFHGALDEVVPASVSEEMVQALRSSGGNPRLTIYSDGRHDVWSRAYSDPSLWEWLFAQQLAA